MAKRGRPRKKRELEPEDGAVAVLDKADIYAPDYEARHWWFVGIKVDRERNQMPFHNFPFGGVGFQQGTQRTVVTEEVWLSLDGHRTRVVRQHLYAHQVKRAAESIKQCVVRWYKRTHVISAGQPKTRFAADVISLENRIKSYNTKKKEFVAAGYRYHPTRTDVPVSKYLVLIPRGFLNDPSAGKITEIDINSLPSMFDLDPSLIPDRMGGHESAVGDEPW